MPLSINNVSHLPFCIYNGKDLSNILKVFQRRRLNTVAEIEIHSRAHKCGHHDWHLPRWDYAYVFHQIAIAPSVPCVGAQMCHPKRPLATFQEGCRHGWEFHLENVPQDWLSRPLLQKNVRYTVLYGRLQTKSTNPSNNKLALLRKIVQCQNQQRCLSSINRNVSHQITMYNVCVFREHQRRIN